MLLRDSLLFPDCLFVRNCLPPCSCCHRGATTALRLVRNQRRGCRPEGRLYAHISAPKVRPETPGDGTSAFYMPLRLCRARGARELYVVRLDPSPTRVAATRLRGICRARPPWALLAPHHAQERRVSGTPQSAPGSL